MSREDGKESFKLYELGLSNETRCGSELNSEKESREMNESMNGKESHDTNGGSGLRKNRIMEMSCWRRKNRLMRTSCPGRKNRQVEMSQQHSIKSTPPNELPPWKESIGTNELICAKESRMTNES
jgi:hypothetical protein